MLPNGPSARALLALTTVRNSRLKLVEACCCLLGPCLGCAQGGRDVAPLPIDQRLREAYPDLQTSRFSVIADFEGAEQIEHFTLQSDSAEASSLALSPAGIEPTGGGCLAFTLGGPAELVMDVGADSAAPAPSDWSAYNLLLMNVAVDQEATLELVIVAGVAEQESRSACLLPLSAGWNPIRLDLNEAAQQLPLRDVRRLHWRILEPGSSVPMKLDDLVLADNRQEIFGDPNGENGKLYVVRDGRHINVGACGRFELGFLNGQIVRWFSLDSDPMRLTNLVGPRNVLGPAPVEVNTADLERQIRAGELPIGVQPADRLIAARQRVIEAQDARVFLECDWTPATSEHAALPAATIRWTYAVYPTGDVYVTVASRASAENGRLGLAVSRLPVHGLVAQVEEPADPSGPCYGALGAPGSGCLLFVPRGGSAFDRMRVVRDPLHPRVSLLALGSDAAPDFRAACLLAVWPTTNCDAARQKAIAESYAQAPAIEFLIGDLDPGTDGDLDSDGYNERFGAYALAMHENRVQMSIDGRKRPVHQPVFMVPNTAGKEVWVYVDHLILPDLHRDRDENVLFQLPEMVDRPVVIELYARGG